MQFRSNGKLLLTGEYLVLRGAKALAFPLRFGQSLKVETITSFSTSQLHWTAFKPGNREWFRTSFNLPSLDIAATNDRTRSVRLQLILMTLQQLNPVVFLPGHDYHIETRLDFEPEWGFGSSSTLIYNLSAWAKIDPYALLNLSVGGSGYDIACAGSDEALIYQRDTLKPITLPIRFRPPFADHLLFVYQDKKQDSMEEVNRFNRIQDENELSEAIGLMSKITERISLTDSLNEFCDLLKAHEDLMSNVLQLAPIESKFPDFEGQLKSLGAWGGDFFLAVSQKPMNETKAYFSKQGLTTFFSFNELII